MIKCPFCHFENEDGALFCERCTSDLTAVAATPAAVPPLPAGAVPLVEAVLIPAGPDLVEAIPIEAVPLAIPEALEAIPLAPIAVTTPVDLQPVAPPPLPPSAAAGIPTASMPPIDPTPFASLSAAPVPAVEPGVPVAPAPVVAAPAPAVSGGPFPSTTQPRLLVLRGQKRNVEYPIYEGLNFIGRADEKPVDIDLEEQEPPDRVWCSRQHACISWENDEVLLEDLNSANGTYVNRTRVYPGQKKALSPNDVIQIGNVQLKVLV